jgi:hypothetical protein
MFVIASPFGSEIVFVQSLAATINPIVSMTEFCHPVRREAIMVANNSPDIQKDGFLVGQFQAPRRIAGVVQNLKPNGLFAAAWQDGAMGSYIFPLYLPEWKISIFQVTAITPLDVNEPTNITSWQVSDVSKSHLAKQTGTVDLQFDAQRVNSDISAFKDLSLRGLVLGGSLGIDGKLSGSFPQFIGGEPQACRKNSQHDREESDDRPFVFVKARQQPSKSDEDRSAEGGAFFLAWLAICAAAGLGAYWMATKQR